MDEFIPCQLLSQISREFLLGMYKLVQVLDGLQQNKSFVLMVELIFMADDGNIFVADLLEHLLVFLGGLSKTGVKNTAGGPRYEEIPENPLC